MGKLGKLIRTQREKSGLSQRRLAELVNISNTEISRIESGERKRPAPFILKRIAPHIGVNYKELLEAAGYDELFVEQNSMVAKEDSLAYVNAVKDFSNLTPEEQEKLKTFKEFLLSRREKKG